MIVSYNDTWAIMTPAKTGTLSLEKLFVDCLGTAFQLWPRHRTEFPDWIVGPTFMSCRDPYERWCSMLYFNKNRHGWPRAGQLLREKGVNAYAEFFFAERKAGRMLNWTSNQTQLLERCGAVGLLRLEHLAEDLAHYRVLGYRGRIPHVNSVKRNTVAETMKLLNDHNTALLEEWCDPDLVLGRATRCST